MNNQLLLRCNAASKLKTLTVFGILLFLPVFLLGMAFYMYPDDASMPFILTGFGAFVSGGTILFMRKAFIDGLRFSPVYVLNDFGIVPASGKLLKWSDFEKAVVFFIEKEKSVGFKFKTGKHDSDMNRPELDISSRWIFNATGFPFTIQLDAFTESEAEILKFIKRKLPVETLSEPVKLDEKAFGDAIRRGFF